jgi:hypothetical protein
MDHCLIINDCCLSIPYFQSRLMSVSCTPYSYVFEVTLVSLTPID